MMPAIPAKPPPHVSPGESAGPRARDGKEFNADDLFAGAKEIVIRHDGERYRLRRTSKGKLILTK